MKLKITEKHDFFFLMTTGVLIGAFLRLYRIGSQIIWDDEWHAIQIAIFNPLKYIVTHFHWNYNSIPLTIYFRIMLESIGLNEINIRLPQLLSGTLMLVIFPLIIKKLFNKRIALIFLFLIAISPLLVYFSRNSLSYSTVVLLSFISIFSFYQWMKEKKTIYVSTYIVTAVLAPYFHISSVAFVSAPILYVIILSMIKKRPSFNNEFKNIPQVKHILFIIFGFIVGISICFFPLIKTMEPIMKHSSKGYIDIGTLGGCAILFSGSKSYIICIILLTLFVYGLYVLYVTNKLLFTYLSAICLSQLLYIVIPRPFLVQKPIIFTRYFLPSLPIWLLIISIALNGLHTKLKSFIENKTKVVNAYSNLALVSLLLILFMTGPITDVYGFPNDFTNHKDFQYNYIHLKRILNKSDSHERLYPKFYVNLKEQAHNMTIIEFPANISWQWNFYHVYQRLHKNRVKIGYNSDEFGPFFGYDTFENRDVGFNNFIDISNPKQLSVKEADFIVVHKNIWKECVTVGWFDPENRKKMEDRLSILPVSTLEPLQKYVSRTIAKLKSAFGKPFYEDSWIIVHRVK
ncbi:MAG: glycosyltransferase family 39 protein [Candidatus Hodarchaeota archaeon]